MSPYVREVFDHTPIYLFIKSICYLFSSLTQTDRQIAQREREREREREIDMLFIFKSNTNRQAGRQTDR